MADEELVVVDDAGEELVLVGAGLGVEVVAEDTDGAVVMAVLDTATVEEAKALEEVVLGSGRETLVLAAITTALVVLEEVAAELEKAGELVLVGTVATEVEDRVDAGGFGADDKVLMLDVAIDEPKADERVEANTTTLEALVETTAGDVPELEAILEMLDEEGVAEL
ncbi:hypothetical protein A1O7_04217 [Cladophialophora yegresii CBS 114405]|uniref:Uncharacterized protein n=1 Tax=Cladophialophora yegresii CBS 114405 TaxID=1182544 RepID=W9VW53_9EURO|nr:uncharacterized protein A1O7_04217 [Cladophialophora yegresii CBS 114405]EXJ60067.1 hypothetical protein A1O7_04217 [Cladophialophora yegresii CBS 114405]